MHAHAFDSQHIAPDRGQLFLHGCTRCDIAISQLRSLFVGRWQGPPIQFAVAGERKLFQVHECGWQHVFGELALEMLSQLAVAGPPLMADKIGHQLLFSRNIFAGGDNRLAHVTMLAEHRLNLTQLNPEPANFDLVIDASQILDIAIREEAGEVARAVEAVAGLLAEWVGDEGARR